MGHFVQGLAKVATKFDYSKKIIGDSKVGPGIAQLANPGGRLASKLSTGPLTTKDVLNPRTVLDPALDPANLVIKKSKAAAALPQTPSVGDAQFGASQNLDFLRRRRGVLANLYGGGAGQSGSSSSGATLLGG